MIDIHNRPYEIPEFLKSYGVPTIVNAFLKTDPLYEAEKETGESYKDNQLTIALGFLKMAQLSRDKNKLLVSNQDTILTMSIEDWESVVNKIGFKNILTIPFESTFFDKTFKEKFVICWLEPGLLLCYDTFMGKRRNSSHVYYCWKPDNENDFWEFTSSGEGYNGIWLGNHDVREALRFKLHRLFLNGTFITPWPKQHFLWLLHYQDTKKEQYNYQEINKERISMLPKDVVSAIGY